MKEEMQLVSKDKNGIIRKELTTTVWFFGVIGFWIFPIVCLIRFIHCSIRKDLIWIKKEDYYKLMLKQIKGER